MSKSLHQVLLDAALGYAAQGIPVFPCKRNKTPATKNGFKDATTNEAQIRKWWEKNAWSIGMPTGQVSRRIVFDVDGPKGEESFRNLEAQNGPLPETLEARTQDGRHLHFDWPGVYVQISSDLRFGGPGVDMRGDGGYAIVPPSPFPKTDGYYTFTNALPPARAPDWLIRLANTKPNAKAKPRCGPKVDANRLLDRALDKARQEGRNGAGFWLACQLRDNQFSFDDALAFMGLYASKVGPTNTKGEPEPYTSAEAESSLRQAYSEAPREPWGGASQERAAPELTGTGDERPVLKLLAGKLPWIVTEAGTVLTGQAETLRIFQRKARLVHIFALPDEKKMTWGRTTLQRQAGTLLLESLEVAALTDIFGRLIRWQRFSQKAGWHDADCPPQIAVTYKSRTGQWGLPALNGLISAPLVRPDGTVLHRAGYDADTGLYLTEDWPAVSNHPTLDDAQMALKFIVETFGEFPFISEAHRSTFTASILTALQRRLLASAPLFGFSAPSQRTGKSLLAECTALIATGREAPACAVSENREEQRKLIAAVLLEGHAIINLDNIEFPLKSPDLSRAITQPFYQDRILGRTGTTLAMPTNLLWTATGNNLLFRGDLAVRTLLCQLDANMEHPEERAFKIPRLKAHVLEHRAELVSAGLTILRAYVKAGKPPQEMLPWGGFEDWSESIRAALLWLGLHDPCETRQHIIEDDPDREHAAALISTWHVAFGQEPKGTAEALETADTQSDLKAALLAVAAAQNRHDAIDPRRLSWWLRTWQGRIIAGLRLDKSQSTYKGHPRWFVKPCS